jgi:hypothetical protein
MSDRSSTLPVGDHQLEHRIEPHVLRERRRGRSGRHREVALHDRLEALQVRLENLRLFRVRNRSNLEIVLRPASLQYNPPDRLRVANPLRPPARAYEVTPVVDNQQLNRRRVQLAALAPPHLQQIVMRSPEPQSHHQAEQRVERPLDHIWPVELLAWCSSHLLLSPSSQNCACRNS